MTTVSKTAKAALVAATLAGAIATSGGAAEARGAGWGIGAGLLGAAIAGSVIASQRPAYAAPVYYSEPTYRRVHYVRHCQTVRRVNSYGELVYRRYCH